MEVWPGKAAESDKLRDGMTAAESTRLSVLEPSVQMDQVDLIKERGVDCLEG